MNRFYLQMHITNRCHNRCKHCYQENYGGEDMHVVQAKAVLTELYNVCKKIDVRSEVAITGGDPLMAGTFFRILSAARKLCDKVGVLGNPELLTANAIKRLADVGIEYYQLSLDGISQTHDNNRYQGSFVKTCVAIRKLSDAGIKVNINMTLTDENRYQINTVKAIAKNSGANYVGYDEYVPNGEDCAGKKGCSLGFAVMTILPNLVLMACRRTPSSVLGKWSSERGLEYYFVHSKKMKSYRAMRKNATA